MKMTFVTHRFKEFNNSKRRSHEKDLVKRLERAIDPDTVEDSDLEKKEDPWSWD